MKRLGVVGAVVAVAGLLAGACGGGDKPEGPTASVPRATTTTDPYAVPAVIDEAYVNRVLAGLDQAVGDVVRLVVSSRTIPPEALRLLRLIYVDEAQFQFQILLFESDLRGGLSKVRANPGNRVTTVIELLSSKPNCVFAKVDMDTSAVTTAPNPAFRTRWVAIVPLQPQERSAANATGWGMIYDGFQSGNSAPPDPCAER